MPIVQNINNVLTRKEESKSAFDKDIKTEKVNYVDDTKDGNENVADFKPVCKRTLWQRLKDKLRKIYSDNDTLIKLIALVCMTAFVCIGLPLLAALVSPYFLILFGICCLIFISLDILSDINEYKRKRTKNYMK